MLMDAEARAAIPFGGFLALVFLAACGGEPEPAPAPAPGRVPWTTSRLHGSPEPPPAFRTERVYPNLTFKQPVDLCFDPTGSRLWVVERAGKIFSFPDDPGVREAELAIDLPKEVRGLDRVEDCKGVAESYAIAFHPDFARNRFCYVMYILAHKTDGKNLPKGSRISRFTVPPAAPPRLDPASEQVLVEWIAGGHNGCALKFGPDGFLYASTGDGTAPNPPDAYHTGQDVSDLLSSILRIDVDHPADGLPYGIPKDNPLVGVPGARAENWAWGLRNPWRMNFDRLTGDLWVGDVGWEKWELVYRVRRGGNYGWSLMEGPQPVNVTDRPAPGPILPPDHAIPHPEGASITGGFLYRGKAFPELAGTYVYGDWETRLFWSNPWDGQKLGERRTIAATELRVIAFAEDRDGELLILDFEAGGLHRFARNEASKAASDFPRKLSATGLFRSLAPAVPAPGVVPYEINAPLWMDGARAQRWIAVPGIQKVGCKDGKPSWPADSVLAKTIALEGKPVETQVLHFDGRRWNAYAYLWNEAGTDAELTGAMGASKGRWTVQGRAACLTCHNPWPGVALSINSAQLSRGAQVPRLRDLDLLPREIEDKSPLVDPRDEAAPLVDRARAYLHVNCSHCHRFGAGGAALIDLRREATDKEFNLVGVRPALGTFELDDPHLVSPGDPGRSVLLYRVAKLGRGRMPHIGSEVVDVEGFKLLARWIRELPGGSPGARSPESPSGALDRLVGGEPLGAEDVRRGLESKNPLVRDLFERFAPPGSARKRLGTSIDPAAILALKGDADRGRDLVFESALNCRACHRFGTGDEKMGPELGKIAAKLDRRKLLESILDPSKDIEPKYVNYLVETATGAILSGILAEKTAEKIVLQDAEKTTPLELKNVKRLAAQQKSIMPEYLLQDLTAQEAADLVEFLSQLK